eukprot:TRINITY_DN1049_c0_g1_i10.p1 TRINITY_DN1049_c0_g1~~TRINITY_DN1049_c0_g1_i10.p1  ORF type:complete len:175 (-),score=29.45 TRINITY_DN1049_c0_g1_i10:1233-1757(-)
MLCSNIDSKIKWRNAMEPIEFSKLVSEEIGLGVHWQNIHKYIKSNICKDFKVRKKNKALPQFPPSIMFEEIGLKEKEVQATMKHVNQHMDKKLKEALKKFNGNAKKLLKEVKQPSSIHRSLEILLEMVGGMSGGLLMFLSIFNVHSHTQKCNGSYLQYVQKPSLYLQKSFQRKR